LLNLLNISKVNAAEDIDTFRILLVLSIIATQEIRFILFCTLQKKTASHLALRLTLRLVQAIVPHMQVLHIQFDMRKPISSNVIYYLGCDFLFSGVLLCFTAYFFEHLAKTLEQPSGLRWR
jgi:hypothetical protein